MRDQFHPSLSFRLVINLYVIRYLTLGGGERTTLRGNCLEYSPIARIFFVSLLFSPPFRFSSLPFSGLRKFISFSSSRYAELAFPIRHVEVFYPLSRAELNGKFRIWVPTIFHFLRQRYTERRRNFVIGKSGKACGELNSRHLEAGERTTRCCFSFRFAIEFRGYRSFIIQVTRRNFNSARK